MPRANIRSENLRTPLLLKGTYLGVATAMIMLGVLPSIVRRMKRAAF